jgi:hypothetical protein
MYSMNDLISRKAVYEMLHGLGGCDATDEWADGWDKAIDSAIKELDKIPTAYDVDKVVGQLERERKFYANWKGKAVVPKEEMIGISKGIKLSIEIMKGAVKDEKARSNRFIEGHAAEIIKQN